MVSVLTDIVSELRPGELESEEEDRTDAGSLLTNPWPGAHIILLNMQQYLVKH